MLRAYETERPDALFHDSWARQLAGAEAETMVRKLSHPRFDSKVMAVRTRVFDELVLSTIQEEDLDTVVNLASGLDTRPFRLPLPAKLKWIEADLPEMIAYKRNVLGQEPPKVQWDARGIDLADAAARQAFLDEVQRNSQRALVITEGFLMYLTENQVSELGADLHDRPVFRRWISDLLAPNHLRWIRKRLGDFAREHIHFAPQTGPEFFRSIGFAPVAFKSFADEARRLNRESSWLRYGRLLSSLAPKWWDAERQHGCVVLRPVASGAA
jgi:methyltransferase (TIGR00027 family)